MTEVPRRWLELSVRSASAGSLGPLLAEGLVVLGARGVLERGGAYVSYFEEPPDVEAFLDRARVILAAETGLDSITLEHAWQDHEEWSETWKRGLVPRRVTPRIVVHPSWTEPDDIGADDVVIVLDPGMAFGTAEHGTTRGCLRLLDGLVRPGDRLLEVGAGSGILAIAAARLGAEQVTAIEGDAFACEALAENVALNGVEDRVDWIEAWATADSIAAHAPLDGIIANIERGLLEPLFTGFRDALAPGAWLILSGILDREWDVLSLGVAENGFRPVSVDADGEWRSGLFERTD